MNEWEKMVELWGGGEYMNNRKTNIFNDFNNNNFFLYYHHYIMMIDNEINLLIDL